MQVSSIVVPLLKFYFHEEVRIGSVQILCELLRSADIAADKGLHGSTKANVKQLLDYIWPALIEAISKVALALMHAFLCAFQKSLKLGTSVLQSLPMHLLLVSSVGLQNWGNKDSPIIVRMALELNGVSEKQGPYFLTL